MKYLKISILALSFFTFIFSSCDKDDNTSGVTTASILQQGAWKVSSFIDSGNDETNHFSGDRFTFQANGTVTVLTGSGTVSGTWTTGSDDSLNKLELNFGSAPLDDLTEDWHILTKSSSTISLEDVSGGGGGTDLLVFEKL